MEQRDENTKVGTVGFITIGCRANQADTAIMATNLCEIFSEANPFSAEKKCDFIIVNTCTVTSRAEADARKLIRRAKRIHTDARVIVTGCAAQVDYEKWRGMPEVDHVLGILDRDRIREIFEREQFNEISGTAKPSGGVLGSTPTTGHRSRPFLKIQDGCTRGCSYCIVPRARGPERSRPLDMIVNDLVILSENGYREIVLSGIHLGRWGVDLNLSLTDLLEELDKLNIDSRIRLSSLEPMDLTPELIIKILTIEKICPHLHIPLQSGDQGILDAMGRGHTIEDYVGLIRTAREIEPNVSIGTDIIVGFPGETIESHKNTIDLIKENPFSYLHVFTYSPRPGTRAEKLPDRPAGGIVRERMREMKTLDSEKRVAFLNSQAGTKRNFLIETPDSSGSSLYALSDNYIRILVKDSVLQSRIGILVPMIIDINGIEDRA